MCVTADVKYKSFTQNIYCCEQRKVSVSIVFGSQRYISLICNTKCMGNAGISSEIVLILLLCTGLLRFFQIELPEGKPIPPFKEVPVPTLRKRHMRLWTSN